MKKIKFVCKFVNFSSFFLQNKWIPRRKEAGPKKIEEIHSEAKMEELQQKIELNQHQQRQIMQQQQGPSRGSQQGQRGSQRGPVPSKKVSFRFFLLENCFFLLFCLFFFW